MSEGGKPRSEQRTEAIRQRRRSRADIHRERQRRQRFTRVVAGGGAVVAIAIVAYFVVTAIQDRQARQPPGDVRTFEDIERGHTPDPVEYEQTPPVGGIHAAIWQDCGFYSAPIANENGVHSLEHGAVWITYSPDLAAAQVEVLRDLAEDQEFVLVSPYPDLPAPAVGSAWGKQLEFDSATDPNVKQFVSAYQRGSQTPEPGAPCSGGTSATQ